NDKGNTAFRKRYAQQFGVKLENEAEGVNKTLEKQASSGDDTHDGAPASEPRGEAHSGVAKPLIPQGGDPKGGESGQGGTREAVQPARGPNMGEVAIGFGDGVSLGGTKYVRQALGIQGDFNPNSPEYKAGELTGRLLPVVPAAQRAAQLLKSTASQAVTRVLPASAIGVSLRPESAEAEENRGHSNNAPGGSTQPSEEAHPGVGVRSQPSAQGSRLEPSQGRTDYFGGQQRFEAGSGTINPTGGNQPPPPVPPKEKYVKPQPPTNWEHIPKNMRESGEKLIYDGQFLSYWKDGRIDKVWSGVSGEKGFQSKEHQSVVNKGPIPQGRYSVAQGQHQSIGGLDRLIGKVGQGNFPGGVPTWGEHRVWLKPSLENEMHGRTKFTIHGGSEPGSAGCIDLTDEMESFSKWFKDHKKDLDLEVFYP
ncbi:MAG: DUF2778 domain-containing protein, partial [Magnetococcales bacterium]|nr:DUF2778 domain-containing protein [Magnetococcales bacterium]